VPRDLFHVIGRPLIRKSLGTSDDSKAIRLRNLEEVQTDAFFAKLRRQPGIQMLTQTVGDPSAPSVSSEALIAQARQMVERRDARAHENSISDLLDGREEQSDVADNLEYELTALQERRDPMAQPGAVKTGLK
jgi:hypothetical protein